MTTENEKKMCVTVTYGMRGFFAVLLWWNPDHGGFWEPWNSGIGSYSTSKGAEDEAKSWAEAEGVEYIEKGKLTKPEGMA